MAAPMPRPPPVTMVVAADIDAFLPGLLVVLVDTARVGSANLSAVSTPLFLGTVAIEPNRWGAVDPDLRATITVSEWLDRIAAIGFDGLELWERHATTAPDGEVAALADGPVPVSVFNTYAGWEDDDGQAADREAVTDWVARLDAPAVKFNLGNDRDQAAAYQRRLEAFDDAVPDGVRLLCECHFGTAGEFPEIVMPMFDAVADRDRLQTIIHLHPEPDGYFEPALAGFGDRIGHVHVQLWDVPADQPASDLAEQLKVGVGRLRDVGFDGSATLEFCGGLGSEDDHPAGILDRAERDHEALRAAFGD